MSTITAQRKTKYCIAIEEILERFGHATNQEILMELRNTFPTLSATTVHRATARLAQRGTISIAPHTNDGSMRYDANTNKHDHFICSSCDVIKDANIINKVAPVMESAISGCHISGPLTIFGVCKECALGGKK
jgi:Fe2+ or Zn2+ uptake regulation protein